MVMAFGSHLMIIFPAFGLTVIAQQMMTTNRLMESEVILDRGMLIHPMVVVQLAVQYTLVDLEQLC